MAVTDTILVQYVLEDPENGHIEVGISWNGGSTIPFTFDSREQMVSQMGGGLTDQTDAGRIMFRWWLGRDPTGTVDATVVGKTLSIDFSEDVCVQPDA